MKSISLIKIKDVSMKRIAITISVAVLILAFAAWIQIPAQTETESVEQELIQLENEWAEAWVKSDVAFSDRIMADDFMWTSPWGKVFSKADNLALIKSREDVIASWVVEELKVRVYGDAAVVTGRCAVKETYKGQDVSGQERWTHTWIKITGRWQCVAGHSSEIAQE